MLHYIAFYIDVLTFKMLEVPGKLVSLAVRQSLHESVIGKSIKEEVLILGVAQCRKKWLLWKRRMM